MLKLLSATKVQINNGEVPTPWIKNIASTHVLALLSNIPPIKSANTAKKSKNPAKCSKNGKKSSTHWPIDNWYSLKLINLSKDKKMKNIY